MMFEKAPRKQYASVEGKVFNVLGKTACPEATEATLHAIDDRLSRINTYNKALGVGKVIDAFIVDTNHWNGHEIHVLHSNRRIDIYNQASLRFITCLYARPQQIKRYYNGVEPKGKFVPFKHDTNLNEI
jgi:hypothetical protein